jgi:hypothetical protein
MCEDKNPDKTWRAPFENFGKNLLKIIYKRIAENSPCGVARLSTAGRMAR